MSSQPKLFCQEAGNRNGKGSLMLIHGAFGAWQDWEMNIPYLEKDYHLLLPDLPHHGQSQHIEPYSSELSAKLLADIIRERGQNGRAHVVGLSLGAFVALDLISRHPDVVGDVFISGYKRYKPNQYMPYGFWFSESVEKLLPRSFISWLMDGIQFSRVERTPLSLPLCKEIIGELTPDAKQTWPSPWPARTLIVSAGKAGIVPSADHPDAAVKLRDIGRQLNQGTVAYTHPRMRHPWHRQDPKLFAETAKLWIEEGKVPEGFIEL